MPLASLARPHLTRTVQSTWIAAIRTVWEIDPAIAVHFAERFKPPVVTHEIARSVRSEPRKLLHVADALRFLVGDKLDTGVHRDLKVCISPSVFELLSLL